MAGDGLSHQDLLDLEALRLQALRNAEAQVQREAQRQHNLSTARLFQSTMGGAVFSLPPGLGQGFQAGLFVPTLQAPGLHGGTPLSAY